MTNFDDRLATLLDDMRETMIAADGVGLAGPQVGMLRRVFVVWDTTDAPEEAFIISAVTLTSGCANGTPKTEEAKSEQKTTEENAVVPIKPITEKAIDDNPYMSLCKQSCIRTSTATRNRR